MRKYVVVADMELDLGRAYSDNLVIFNHHANLILS